MFYDDVHPSADMHVQLAEHAYSELNLKYKFTEPTVESVYEDEVNISEDRLLASYRKMYGDTLKKDQNGFFGFFRRSNILHRSASLDAIIDHALYNGGGRSLSVMKELRWFDEKNNLNLNIPVLKRAYEGVVARHEEDVSTTHCY